MLYEVITRALESLLLNERAALEARNLEQIQQATADKNQLLPKIEQNFAARQQALAACGVNASAEGWTALLDTLPTEPARTLANDWQALSEALRNNFV